MAVEVVVEGRAASEGLSRPLIAYPGVGAVYDRTVFEPKQCALIERTYTFRSVIA